MTSAVKPAPAPESVEAVKGVVQVADKSTSKTVDDRVAPAAPPPAVAEAPAQMPRPAMPQRPGILAPKPVKPGTKAPTFKTGEFIVYPAHGVGEIIAIEPQEVAGYKLELFVISFIKDKMILKVPLPKAASVGMRKLADAAVMKRALDHADRPRPRQAHDVVAPRPGVRGQDQLGRPRRDRRGRARPLPAPTPARAGRTPSVSSTRPRSTGWRASSPSCRS